MNVIGTIFLKSGLRECDRGYFFIGSIHIISSIYLKAFYTYLTKVRKRAKIRN